MWIKKGGGSLIAGGVSHRLEANAVYLLMPGRLRVLDWKGETDACIIHFSAEFLYVQDNRTLSPFFSDCYGDVMTAAFLTMDEDTLREMQELMFKMKKEFHQHSITRPAILQSLLTLYLIYFSANIATPPPGTGTNYNRVLADKFLSLVRDSYKCNKSVSSYASRLNVSPNYLNEVVKKFSGSSASYHIKQCIISEAKSLALYSGLSMKEIAFHLGFGDPYHFSKFFKNSSGVNFSSFKKEHRSVHLSSTIKRQPLEISTR